MHPLLKSEPGTGTLPALAPDEAGTRPRNRIHVLRDGFLFSSAGADLSTCRHAAVLLLALDERGFELEAAGRTRRHQAVVMRPYVAHSLLSRDAAFACLDMQGTHALFRRFSRLPDPGVRSLAIERFTAVLPMLHGFQQGVLDDSACRDLYELTLSLAACALPDPGPADARIQRVLVCADRDPACSIDTLAEVACLSPDRLSHLFSQEMGLSLRRYLQSMKIRAAARLYGKPMTLTEIALAAGFCDSAHFSKVWMQAYGTPPGHYFTRKASRIHPGQIRSAEGPRSRAA